jgi:hypothetical protein
MTNSNYPSLTITPNEVGYNDSLFMRTEDISCTVLPRVVGCFSHVPELEGVLDTSMILGDDRGHEITFYYGPKSVEEIVVATNMTLPYELKGRVDDPSLVSEPTIVGVSLWRQEYVSVVTRRSARLLWDILTKGGYTVKGGGITLKG